MDKLPLFPQLDGGEMRVVQYPTNAQTVELVSILLRSAGVPDEVKQALLQREGVDESDISQELPAKETDMRVAELVTKGDLPDGATWNDLSTNALSEAQDIFFGGDGRRSSVPPGLLDSLNL